MSVITAFGPSPTFIGEDAIQQACNQQQGYEMVNTWPVDIQDRSTWQQYRLRVPIIAYMDDTSYLISSGDKIQASINIITQFYHFHDVDINGKKSELMVINPKVPRDELYITIGRDNSKVQATDKEIRYLGSYFSSSNLRKRSIKRIKDIIEKFLNPIRRKRITVGHIAYLINHILIPRVVYVA
ncbi:hypothetical protein RirG_246440 [Rhizophagus irregularis DAOM 197198w]|uniref:Uncharacterized protein n=1 Tax=Rhizophagus irregularis (strain DAOM 197198w) TaxID=1432141 RepID=A0A015IGQ7_RHIIW|nr:hypothetical protein RirG_246440 [Rhizophagus irregularis DAOM 197198w]